MIFTTKFQEMNFFFDHTGDEIRNLRKLLSHFILYWSEPEAQREYHIDMFELVNVST